MDGSTAAYLAVVQITTIQLTCNHAAFKASVRDDVEHVVRARNVQRAFHDHDVFERGVHGLAGDDAATEVSPNIGILDQEVLDGCTTGLSEETGVSLGVKDVVGIFQAGDGMVLAIEHATKRKVFAAERQVLDRAAHDILHVLVAELKVAVKINLPVGGVFLTR